jgi:AraC-like DNA-binding protein
VLQQVDTGSVHPAQRLRHWQEQVCEVFPAVGVSGSRSEPFFGEIGWRRIGGMTVSTITSTVQDVVRTARHIQAAQQQFLQLNYQLAGRCRLEQDGRDTVAQTGDLVLYDSARPYRMQFDGPFRQLSIEFPRAAFRERFGPTEAFTSRRIQAGSGAGRFLASFVQSLIAAPHGSDVALADRLEGHVLDLLATALSEISDPPAAHSASHAVRLHRLKRYMVERLDHADLAPAEVAAAHRMSVRQLHYLFSSEDSSFRGWLQAARLRQAQQRLADPVSARVSIGEIALSLGFKEAAHFSRVFRQEFGLSPREWRAEARQSWPALRAQLK